MKILVPVLAALLVAGCASTAADPTDKTAMHCTRETPIGTSIPVTRCRTAEQAAREKAEAEAMNDPNKRGMSGMRSGPDKLR